MARRAPRNMEKFKTRIPEKQYHEPTKEEFKKSITIPRWAVIVLVFVYLVFLSLLSWLSLKNKFIENLLAYVFSPVLIGIIFVVIESHINYENEYFKKHRKNKKKED
ncbi:hypothetical protein M5J17_04520 [Streptococcus koreensis]|uniref:hypothetical protein n=1 Tax=Streptococcus koreensis TaxID=2382163 RepID=UPI003CF0D9C0